MRLVTTFFLASMLLAVFGCGSQQRMNSKAEPSSSTSGTLGRYSGDNAGSAERAVLHDSATAIPAQPESQRVAARTELISGEEQVAAQRAGDAAIARKIISNAELTIETNAPADGQRKVASIAEARGGFVVASEARQRNSSEDQAKPEMEVAVTVRVPSAQFSATVDEIRAVGNRVRAEKITGQDVTEEYIDLEARIRTKKALEAQFMEIMKQAHKVSDALEVQSQLAEVRTEIEQLEGRRRYLERQSSLSTIKVTLLPPMAIVSTTGFFYNVKGAFGDGIDAAVAITLGLIRAVIVLIPILLLIVLPLGLLARLGLRRLRRIRLARDLVKEHQPIPES